MKNLIIICLTLCLAFFSSCEKEVSMPSQFDNKLVVISSICPQLDIIVELGLSKPYYGKFDKSNLNLGTIPNAIITISNDANGSAIVPWDATAKRYSLSQASFPISANRTYYLKVEVLNIGNVSAQTTIPEPILNPSFEFIKLYKNSPNNDQVADEFTYKLSVPNVPSKGNYYRLYVMTEQLDNGLPSTTVRSDRAYSNTVYSDPFLKEYSPSTISPLEIETMSKKKYDSSIRPIASTTRFKHTAYFIACSKEYYNYYKTVGQYVGLEINPFTEVGNVYSNIKDGYGYFGGYNLVAKSLTTTYGN